MNSDNFQKAVQAIRTDHIVGRGTCSVIDECYSTTDLLEVFKIEGITSKTAALRWARRTHRIYKVVADDIAGA